MPTKSALSKIVTFAALANVKTMLAKNMLSMLPHGTASTSVPSTNVNLKTKNVLSRILTFALVTVKILMVRMLLVPTHGSALINANSLNASLMLTKTARSKLPIFALIPVSVKILTVRLTLPVLLHGIALITVPNILVTFKVKIVKLKKKISAVLANVKMMLPVKNTLLVLPLGTVLTTVRNTLAL